MDNELLAPAAIAAALKGDWENAIKINKTILAQDKNNVDALNRLVRAYFETGDLIKARGFAKKVLKIDAFNSIALKSLERWKGLKKGDQPRICTLSANVFLEEPGKTKIISLIHLGSKIILARLDSGEEVEIKPHAHRTCITTLDGKYIGKLPDNLSARLRPLINAGNEYKAFIKSVDVKEVRVFIREVKRAEKFADTASFL